MFQKVVLILSITSDIGMALAQRYKRDGVAVIGTYRREDQLNELSQVPKEHLFYCDLLDQTSIDQFIEGYEKLHLPWDVFVSCPCTPLPLKAFFKGQFDEWSESVHINVIEQMRVLHGLYPLRNTRGIVDVAFFAGGGVNNAVINFSAYTASKNMLIKLCEYLNAENKDLNMFIVGPGWTRTKTHQLNLENLDRDDERYDNTVRLLESGEGTSMEDIYDCIQWCCRKGKDVAGGRNFSVVHDQWKGPLSEALAEELKKDKDMFKLRRWRNDYVPEEK